jgi:small conductance mechanosensitive channel
MPLLALTPVLAAAAPAQAGGLLGALQRAAAHRIRDLAVTLGAGLPDFVLALLIIGIGWVLAGWVSRVTRRMLARTSTEGHVDFVVGRLAFAAVLALAVVLSLGQLGISPAALVAGLGLAGFAIGFALRDIIGNLLAGIMILFQRPFTIGDQVRINEVEGTVHDIRIRDTILRAVDGTLVYVSNDKVYTATIANLTVSGKRRAEVVLAVELTADVEAAMRVAEDAMRSVPGILDTPPPETVLDTIADGAAKFTARFWLDVSAADFESTRSDAVARLKRSMEEAGVALK